MVELGMSLLVSLNNIIIYIIIRTSRDVDAALNCTRTTEYQHSYIIYILMHLRCRSINIVLLLYNRCQWGRKSICIFYCGPRLAMINRTVLYTRHLCLI